MNAMMVQAREMCGRILPLPENDYYHCETVRGVSYNASSDFAHRRVLINIDPILTKQKLKQLVCHEVYPGHFMQFTLRRQAWEQGVGGLDGVLSVCNHSSSCTFEGIADAGISFLGWEEGLDDRANDLVSLIQAALGSAASYRLHTLGWESSRVEDFLRDNAPGGGEGWVANRIKFIQDTDLQLLAWRRRRVPRVEPRGARGSRPVLRLYLWAAAHGAEPATVQLT